MDLFNESRFSWVSFSHFIVKQCIWTQVYCDLRCWTVRCTPLWLKTFRWRCTTHPTFLRSHNSQLAMRPSAWSPASWCMPLSGSENTTVCVTSWSRSIPTGMMSVFSKQHALYWSVSKPPDCLLNILDWDVSNYLHDSLQSNFKETHRNK